MKTIEQLKQEAIADIEPAQSVAALDEVSIKYLGRAKGLFGDLMKTIPQLPAEERPLFGKRLNEAKQELEALIEARREDLATKESKLRLTAEQVDNTLPGRLSRFGYKHILTQTEDRVRAALIGLGFEFVDGPEVEEYKYNFDALNYPEDHPAMDEQNSFYVDLDHLLRTQTTAVQGRILEHRKPPLRIATIGRCFRYEAVDATHSFAFHQVDAFMVDEGVSMANLKGTLGQFARLMFGPKVQVRFRPDFFPFVEPGVDYSITCIFCGGSGCQVCKKSGWIELGGAGLMHPNILEHYGIDTERYSGFAFGLGVERIPMLQYGIDDLRLFLENNLQFLSQFAE